MIKIDINKYKDYSFGEIASNISERVEPQATNLDIYVGLEHLDPECIHIKRKGVPADVKGTKLRVYPGDIIFGKRRAYQRKAGLVDFDGICSAHAMVVRANPEIILPELFPFFMHSDVLMHRAVDVSEGSLSPTIKWKILAEEKFKLPPLPEQKRLADLLWSVDEAIVKYEYLLSHILLVRSSVLKNIYTIKGAKLVSISDLPIKEVNGMWKTKEKSDVMYVAIIRSTEIQAYGEINYDTVQRHKVKISQFKNKKLLNGDIIVERSGGGPDQPVGRVCYFDKIGEDYTFSNFTSVIRVLDKDQLMPKYLLNFLSFFYETRGTERLQKQTTGIRNLDYDLYRKIKIPLKSKREQKKCVDICERIDERRKNIIHQILLKKNIQKQLVNQVFK
jgi:type I restriction enzyme S subunit